MTMNMSVCGVQPLAEPDGQRLDFDLAFGDCRCDSDNLVRSRRQHPVVDARKQYRRVCRHSLVAVQKRVVLRQ